MRNIGAMEFSRWPRVAGFELWPTFWQGRLLLQRKCPIPDLGRTMNRATPSSQWGVREGGLRIGRLTFVCDRAMAAAPLMLPLLLQRRFGQQRAVCRQSPRPARDPQHLGVRGALRGDWGGVLDCEVLAVEANER
jgi:hypothetical protein